MPISKKIIDEIEILGIDEKEKKLVISVLNFEDEGVRNYTKKYDELIKDYLKTINSEGAK